MHYAQGTEAEVGAKDGEEPVEESLRPAELGEGEDNDLKDDEDAVDHRERGTCRLVGHRAASNEDVNNRQEDTQT